MDLVRIRLELAEALADTGLRVYDHEPEKIDFPAAFIGWPKPIEFDQTMARGVRLEGEVFVVVDRNEAKYAQLRLASAVSLVDTSDSIALATEGGDPGTIFVPPLKPRLEAHDPHGAWHSLHVYEIDGLGSYDVAGSRGLGAILKFRMSVRTPDLD